MGVDYLPKVQARKLYQYAQERKEAEREARRLRDLEEKRAESGSVQFEQPMAFAASAQPVAQPVPVVAPPIVPEEQVVVAAPKPDELTEKVEEIKNLI